MTQCVVPTCDHECKLGLPPRREPGSTNARIPRGTRDGAAYPTLELGADPLHPGTRARTRADPYGSDPAPGALSASNLHTVRSDDPGSSCRVPSTSTPVGWTRTTSVGHPELASASGGDHGDAHNISSEQEREEAPEEGGAEETRGAGPEVGLVTRVIGHCSLRDRATG